MNRLCRLIAVGVVAAGASGIASSALAADINVAVAANFAEPAKEIATLFERKTGNKVVFSFGASGQFYTQITQDAPFQVFLSADQERPEKAVSEGFAVPGSRFTYAVGKLVLWSRDPNLVKGESTLKDGTFTKIAIANPVAAPYGTAAIETMKALHVYDALQPKIVQGNSIAQTFQFVDTGNAELGFVALSQVIERKEGSRWLVSSNLYSPIKQDAVLLKKGADSEAATAFLEFLKGPEAAAIETKFGYSTPETN
ncbi:MAG: molybdate ABC transporter substrate-binding protein [Alphaproteobacteria bacterium]|nr:molybdate ABC transporter substrate-binding protein [Alphaproteobacteria bacterium]